MAQRETAPLWERLRRRLRRTRALYDHEWTARFDPVHGEIEARFFVARTPTTFELSRLGSHVEISALEYGLGSDATRIDFTVEEAARENEAFVIAFAPVPLRATLCATLRFAPPSDDFQGGLRVRVLQQYEPDLDLFKDADRAAAQEQWNEAVERLLEYGERFSADNPFVCYRIAEWSQKLGHMDVAEEFAARAAGHGNPEPCGNLYRNIQEERPARAVEEFRQLQHEAAVWSIGAQHGVVVLERHQRHVLGLGGFELRKFREVLEVRRPAAARLLDQLQFPFSRRQHLLHTSLTVIHPGGDVERVPLERFTISDDDSHNIFITLENQKAGHWILPDLAPGDVIDWKYDLLHRSNRVGETPQTFSLSSPFHAHFPTFRARHEFVGPENLPVGFSVHNGELESTREVLDSRVVHAFLGQRFAPVKQTGFAFENLWLNPLIVCATQGPDWTEVARTSRKANFGSAPLDEEPPAPLAKLLDRVPAEHALETAFYWIRDKLRYAAVRSGAEHIGEEDRGRRIVEAGVGDCKDKSYLLALVCRRLGIPYELLCISSENGVLIEEMPADQFDHVFVRAKGKDGWLYLDAANHLSTFGSAPPCCQGMKALVLGEPASIVEIPVDPPSVNRLEIREWFEEFRKGRVAGRFEVTADGQNARLADERWKVASLSMEDPLLAGQEELTRYLPGAIVHDYHHGAETSGSSRFHVEGIHSRGPLTALERHGRVVLPLSWDVPTLPLRHWRILRLDRLFAVDFVMTVGITLRIEGDVRRAVDDVSRTPPLDNAIARVTEDVVEEPDALEIRRTMTLEQKIIRGAATKLVPPSLEHFEKALNMVIACRADSVSDSAG